MKVQERVPWKEYTLLFVSYKEDGKDRKEIVSFRKDEKSKMWDRKYVYSWQVKSDNPALAEKMDNWLKVNPPSPP